MGLFFLFLSSKVVKAPPLVPSLPMQTTTLLQVYCIEVFWLFKDSFLHVIHYLHLELCISFLIQDVKEIYSYILRQGTMLLLAVYAASLASDLHL